MEDLQNTLPVDTALPPLASVNDEDLQKQLQKTESQEARLASKLERTEQRLGSIATSEAVRAAIVHDTAKTVGERKVTDPFKPQPEVPRAPETLMSKYTFARAMGRFAIRFSLHGPRGAEIEDAHAAASGQAGNNTPSYWERRVDVASARRIKRQELRQARARHSEATASAGIGLGQTARLRSIKKRHDLKQEVREQYKAGEISAHELVQAGDAIKRERVTVPVKSVRREVRRERVGAAYALSRANQPLKSRVRSARKKRAESVKNKTQTKITEVQSRRVEIEAELMRRAEESN